MKGKVVLRYNRCLTGVTVTAVCLLCAGRAEAQREGTRPIEFSEPRDSDGSGTNGQQFGAERRRLTDLEDRLSKTFNFFEPEDSLGGARAPLPGAPRRTPTVPRKKPAKSTGFFNDRDDWVFSDPLDKFKDLLDEEDLGKDLLKQTESDPVNQGAEDLLNSLKTDDWLVKGTLGENFWEVPLVGSQRSQDDRDSADPSRDEEVRPFSLGSNDDLRPRLEQVFGKAISRSAFMDREGAGRGYVDDSGYELGRPKQSVSDARRDEYRALMGFGTRPEQGSLLAAPTVVNPASPRLQPFPTGFGSKPLQAEPAPSLQTATPTAWDSLYPRSPIAPTAPVHPSALDPVGVEPTLNSARAPSGVLGNPFYQPPQRQF